MNDMDSTARGVRPSMSKSNIFFIYSMSRKRKAGELLELSSDVSALLLPHLSLDLHAIILAYASTVTLALVRQLECVGANVWRGDVDLCAVDLNEVFITNKEHMRVQVFDLNTGIFLRHSYHWTSLPKPDNILFLDNQFCLVTMLSDQTAFEFFPRWHQCHDTWHECSSDRVLQERCCYQSASDSVGNRIFTASYSGNSLLRSDLTLFTAPTMRKIQCKTWLPMVVQKLWFDRDANELIVAVVDCCCPRDNILIFDASSLTPKRSLTRLLYDHAILHCDQLICVWNETRSTSKIIVTDLNTNEQMACITMARSTDFRLRVHITYNLTRNAHELVIFNSRVYRFLVYE